MNSSSDNDCEQAIRVIELAGPDAVVEVAWWLTIVGREGYIQGALSADGQWLRGVNEVQHQLLGWLRSNEDGRMIGELLYSIVERAASYGIADSVRTAIVDVADQL